MDIIIAKTEKIEENVEYYVFDVNNHKNCDKLNKRIFFEVFCGRRIKNEEGRNKTRFVFLRHHIQKSQDPFLDHFVFLYNHFFFFFFPDGILWTLYISMGFPIFQYHQKTLHHKDFSSTAIFREDLSIFHYHLPFYGNLLSFHSTSEQFGKRRFHDVFCCKIKIASLQRKIFGL